MRDLENRKDIQIMVDSFYSKVREDARLSFLFDQTAKVDWVSHLPRMYDFWESVIFSKNIFSGNPMKKHQQWHSIQSFKLEDFETWLNLFDENLESLFAGPNAIKAQQRAHSIATLIKRKTIYQNS